MSTAVFAVLVIVFGLALYGQFRGTLPGAVHELVQ